jgi:pentatricopeptide repeat protein
MMQIDFATVYDFTASMWVELFFVSCFALGFALLRLTTGGQPAKKGKSMPEASKPKQQAQLFKSAHAEATSGNAANAVAAWQAVQAKQLTPIDTLRHIVQAFLDSDASSLVDNLVQHFDAHSSDASVPKAALAALEVVAQHGDETMMEELFEAFVCRLKINPSVRMQEVLLGGYATVANETKLTELMGQLQGDKQKVSVRGLSLMMRGYLKNGNVDAAAAQIQEMCSENMNVPSNAVVELLRVARQFNRAIDIFNALDKKTLMTTATVASLLEDCLKANDLQLARKVEHFAKDRKVQLNCVAYGALLKIYTSAGDLHAIELFEEVQQTFPFINEGLVVGLLARCAEPKFLRFAEQLAAFLRSRNQMTIIVYSALMKVYSYCNMYSKACDLYEQLVAEGFEPDSMMYGCLMKFSAECGRTDLTRELSAKMPNKKLGVQHYMSLIRAAGQNKDVEKAFYVLEQFREAGGLDTAICNAVLDVCSCVGNMDRAWSLLRDMEKDQLADIISYNTLVKGYCMLSDADRAFEVLNYMGSAGLKPNDVTYNCLINLAASAGDFNAAWKTIQTMESTGIRIDHYTVSTLLKALKKAPNGKGDVGRVLDLIDRNQIDVFCEEVLLNSALEACMKHGEHQRLESLLETMSSREAMQLAPHTYASLIKAFSTLKQIQRCRDLWREMTELRGLEPTDVALGCMLDALVCNGFVQESVALLRKWENRVPVNTVLYSTLIKGFNNIGDTKGATEMWNELRAKKLPMNTTVYNVMIDVHARVGSTREVTNLLKVMEADDLKPDNITKSIVAKAYCVSGEIEKAMDVFRTLPKGRGTNNVVIFNTILDGCVRHQRMELADELIAKMHEFCVVPSNFTLGIIVKMWGRRRKLQEAFAAVRNLPKQYGFVANGSVKTCLFFACLRNDAISQAGEVFEELRASKCRVDAKMFSALINNCARVGQVEKAVKLVDGAYGLSSGRRELPHGEQLENLCLDQLMKSLTKHNEFQRLGQPLLEKMLKARVPMSSQIIAYSWQGQEWS